jgi:hypothetical protein
VNDRVRAAQPESIIAAIEAAAPQALVWLRTQPSFDHWSAPDVTAFGTCPECGRGLRQNRTWDAATEHAAWMVGCPHDDREADE